MITVESLDERISVTQGQQGNLDWVSPTRAIRALSVLLFAIHVLAGVCIGDAQDRSTTLHLQASPARGEVSLSLSVLVRDVALQHPSARARRFELKAARAGWLAQEDNFAPQLSGSLELSDDLVSLPNPLNMGEITPFETRRYSGELRLTQPLKWGTQLSVSARQGQIETTNPFRNCVPGVISERCYDSSLTLSLTQSILRGRDAEANLAPNVAASAQRRASEAALRAEVRRLVERAVSAYLQLSLAQAQRALEERELTLSKRQLAEGNARLEAGVIAASDLLPLRVALAQRHQSLISAQGRVRAAQVELNALLTDAELTSQPIKASLPRAILDSERAHALAQLSTPPLERQHPELLSLDAQIAQLEAQRVSARDQERALLDLSLVWSQSGLGEELDAALKALPNNESRFYGVTLNYQQPLSDRAEHLTAQLESQISARRADRESLARQLNSAWASAVAQLETSAQTLKWARESASASRGSARAASERLEAGRGTLFEMLELQSQALAAETQSLIIEHELAAQSLILLSLSGELLERFGVEVESTINAQSTGQPR